MKILGVVMIVFAGIFIGMIFSNRSMRHIDFLKEYISLILEIKTQIKYTQKPLSQILSSYGENKILYPLVNKCLEFAKSETFESSWQKAFSNLSKNHFVSGEEEKIIKNFGLKLGSTDVFSQEKYCEYNLSLIKPYLEKLLENKSKNQKLPILLGLCAGLIVSIVLI